MTTIVTIVLLGIGAVLLVHLYWRNRYLELKHQLDTEISLLRDSEELAANASRVQQDTLQTLLNSMVEGLLVLNVHQRIVLANPAFCFLFKVNGELQGKTLMEALRLHPLADLVDSLQTQEQVLGYEIKLPEPERWVQVNGAVLRGTGGKRDGTLLVFHDLTRERRLESARKEFVANVSHELRTPLSLIKGYVETLLSGAKDDPTVAIKFLETIERNADRLKLLMDDLLTVSELESRRVRLNIQPTSLPPLVQKVIADYTLRAEAKAVSMSAEVPELRVMADPNRIEQVLGNLLDNAIKYGKTGGRVEVRATAAESEKMVTLVVQDDGPGIPPESIDRVFERFYRVDKARSREQGGTGLGLSIVKHIVQSHQGKVWATSEPGQGAAFHFTLPRA